MRYYFIGCKIEYPKHFIAPYGKTTRNSYFKTTYMCNTLSFGEKFLNSKGFFN
jgi:hypothetical protein